MKIFVTGGAGFIGLHLCKKLLELGNDITVYDNLSNSSYEKTTLLEKLGIHVIDGDILNKSKLSESMKKHDVVIHLAAKISVTDSMKNPESTFETNVCGTQNVLNACLQNQISKIISTSTAAVYADLSAQNSILDESSNTDPFSPYGKSKLMMEQKITEFSLLHNIDAVVLRLFNVYGNGQSSEYAGVIAKFLDDIDNNRHLTIYGNGTQTRNFVYIDDVISSIILSLQKTKKSGTYNIASNSSISILSLANLMINYSGKNIDVQFKPLRGGEIKFSQTSIEKAKSNLGFFPHYDIESGIKILLNNII